MRLAQVFFCDFHKFSQIFYPFSHEINHSRNPRKHTITAGSLQIRYSLDPLSTKVKYPKLPVFTRNFGHLKLHFIERIRNVPILTLNRTDRSILYPAYGIVLTAYALSVRRRSGCKDMQGLHQRLSCSPSGLPYSYGKRHVHRRPVRLP